ncbi:MAG: hypothetical protein M3Q22_04780 [Actinomycetota bacterium]|nr:hypothetical protein [Actinomycetota bacterium]
MPRIKFDEVVRSSGRWLLYGGRMLANVPATATFIPSGDDADPLDFVVKVGIDILDGRLTCVSLTAERLPGGPPITSEGLRRVPVAEYVMGAARYGREILLERIPEADGTYRLAEFEPPPRDFAEGGMTDEALEQVARLYAWAQATGRKATGILLNDYGMPRPTATRWIQTARRRGILREDHQRTSASVTAETQPRPAVEGAPDHGER